MGGVHEEARREGRVMTGIPPIDWGPWVIPQGRGRPYTCKVGYQTTPTGTVFVSHWLTEVGRCCTSYRYEVVCNYRSIVNQALILPCCLRVEDCPTDKGYGEIPCRGLLRVAAQEVANEVWVQLVQAMIQCSIREET